MLMTQQSSASTDITSLVQKFCKRFGQLFKLIKL